MPTSVPATMAAVLLTGHGGPDKLEYRTDVPVPSPGPGEVLIAVSAAGINNTDINTRLGWYSSSTTDSTSSASASASTSNGKDDDGSWSGEPLTFPRIQGADVCGRIVAVGSGVSPDRIGQRVIVRTLMRHYVRDQAWGCWTYGSECDGGFAQFCLAPDDETFTVECGWSDAELAAIPCAYSTAENMLHRAHVKEGERVLVTGASGGVGLAAVQLAKRRGCEVLAVSSAAKADAVKHAGASRVLDRNEPLDVQVDVVVDVVGGDGVQALLSCLNRGGRYVVAGAIAGPLATIDLRTVYLRDLSLLGATFQDDVVFENLVGYIERGEIRPLVSRTFPLANIREAQEVFESKVLPGKLLLIPPKLVQ